jgi:hypothetical protein
VRDRKAVQRQREQRLIQGERRSAIIVKPHSADMTSEEHDRRGDAAGRCSAR